MGGSGWKNRLTETQLANKRRLDRENRRRQRQEAKETITQLEEKIQLLTAESDSGLVNTLIGENQSLRTTLSLYQSRLEDINRDNVRFLEQIAGKNSKVGEIGSYEEPLVRRISAMDKDRCRADTLSVYCELPLYSDANFANQQTLDLVEALMAWKISTNGNLGVDFLLQYFSFEQAPTLLTRDIIRCRVSSEAFYQQLIDDLAQDRPTISARIPATCSPLPNPISSLEYQRRGMALCAYALTEFWFKYLASKWERVLHFWAAYRVFMFWSIPTLQNLEQIPPWLRPTSLQFTEQHPGYLDFVPWPTIRDKLISTWRSYDISQLYRQMAMSLRLLLVDFEQTQGPILSVKADNTGIDIRSPYKELIFNLSNLCLDANFASSYPELVLEGVVVAPESSIEANGQANNSTSMQGLPPDSMWHSYPSSISSPRLDRHASFNLCPANSQDAAPDICSTIFTGVCDDAESPAAPGLLDSIVAPSGDTHDSLFESFFASDADFRYRFDGLMQV